MRRIPIFLFRRVDFWYFITKVMCLINLFFLPLFHAWVVWFIVCYNFEVWLVKAMKRKPTFLSFKRESEKSQWRGGVGKGQRGEVKTGKSWAMSGSVAEGHSSGFQTTLLSPPPGCGCCLHEQGGAAGQGGLLDRWDQLPEDPLWDGDSLALLSSTAFLSASPQTCFSSVTLGDSQVAERTQEQWQGSELSSAIPRKC